MEITILAQRIELAPATPGRVATLSLAQYDRVDIGIVNDGANPVTDVEWLEGVRIPQGPIASDDATVGGSALAALVSGGQWAKTFTGADIPSDLEINAVSTLGTSLAVQVKGRLRAADLFPGT